MLSEEEKAINNMKIFARIHQDMDIVLKLVEKQQKEIEKKNKIIDLMAKMINIHDIYDDVCGQFGKNKDCSDFTNEELCVDCIKQYFYKKVEEEIK